MSNSKAISSSTDPAPVESLDDLLEFEDVDEDVDRDRERLKRILRTPWQDLPGVEHGIGGTHLGRVQSFSVDFNAGGHAWLDRLVQEHTYAGQLLGTPGPDPTPRFLSAIQQVRERFEFYEADPCLLVPTMHRGRRRVSSSNPEALEEWQLLPGVQSIALLTSTDLAQDESHASVVVIWYQDNFGLPGETILKQLREIDWISHAQEWTW